MAKLNIALDIVLCIEDMNLDRVKQLLAIDMKVFEKGFYFVERKDQDEIVYHTYHGTKGLEFENVLIVIEDGFGSSAEDRVFIRKFLENYDSLNEKMPIGEYKKARNLLCVAVTRAIKNLRVIYEGESGIVEEILAKVFT